MSITYLRAGNLEDQGPYLELAGSLEGRPGHIVSHTSQVEGRYSETSCFPLAHSLVQPTDRGGNNMELMSDITDVAGTSLSYFLVLVEDILMYKIIYDSSFNLLLVHDL